MSATRTTASFVRDRSHEPSFYGWLDGGGRGPAGAAGAFGNARGSNYDRGGDVSIYFVSV